MLTLIIGGSGSGKSAFAESLVCSLGENRIYIATMQPFDEECRARIARHRAQRKNAGFETIECYVNLSEALVPFDANVLLEDLSNLLANELFEPDGGGIEAVRRGLRRLLESCGSLTVVTNEVFSGGKEYDEGSLRYLRDLAELNRELAARADLVTEIVCGLPNVLKGELP